MTKAHYGEELQEKLDQLYTLLDDTNDAFMPDNPFGLCLLALIHVMIEDLEAERDSN